jgi:hypothetical protein
MTQHDGVRGQAETSGERRLDYVGVFAFVGGSIPVIE